MNAINQKIFNHMSKKLVTIAVNSFSRANILKNHLESANIECTLTSPDLSKPVEGNNINIRVNEADYSRAIEITDEINQQYGEEEINIPAEKLTINKILVPVEFTEYSVNGCYYALGIAEKYNAEIHLFHCFNNSYFEAIPYTDNADMGMNYDPYIQEIESNARKKIKNLADEIKKEIEKKKITGVSIDYTLTSGPIDDQLIIVHDEYKPDLVVLGTRGKGKKTNDIMGRITTSLIETIDTPVLAIPEETTFDKFNDINVLYTTNFDESDYSAIRKLIGILSYFNIKVFCVHIDTGESGEHIYTKMDKLKQYFSNKHKEIKVEFDIMRNDDMLDGLQKFIDENNINILSLSAHKRNIILRLFYPDVTKKIFFHTNIPLLVFPT